MAGNIIPSELANVRQAVELAFTNTATVEAVWKHGSDPLVSTYYTVVNDGTGGGTPYWPCTITNVSAVYGSAGPSMNVVKGTAVAASYTAVSSLVTTNASAAP